MSNNEDQYFSNKGEINTSVFLKSDLVVITILALLFIIVFVIIYYLNSSNSIIDNMAADFYARIIN